MAEPLQNCVRCKMDNIKATISAFREVTFTAAVTKETLKRFLDVAAPKYMRTELRFPRKKKRGTMRRMRKWQKEMY